MTKLKEQRELENLIGKPLRSPKQTNLLFEADCEVLRLGPGNYICTSTDSVGEEITIGLYKNIETWGWLTVMNAVSDLAASGSAPLGLTLSTQWAFKSKALLKKKFFTSVAKACRASNVPLLGGDSGYAKDHVMTASILGHSTIAPLTRIGARAGDYIVLAHNNSLGAGPALAMSYLLKNAKSRFNENFFRPAPSWKLSARLRPYATAAIDTSDGLTIGLYTLALLNDLGFEIQWNQKVNHPRAQKFCVENKISPVQLWLGDLGDLQTLWVVPEKNIKKIKFTNTVILGRWTKQKKYLLKYGNQKIDLPVHAISDVSRDAGSYLKLLKQNSRYLAHLD